MRRIGQAERARWAAEAEAKAAVMTAQADRERARRKVLTDRRFALEDLARECMRKDRNSENPASLDDVYRMLGRLAEITSVMAHDAEHEMYR